MFANIIEKADTVIVEKRCIGCGKVASIEVPKNQFYVWRSGVHCQDAFPQLSRETREILISGTHPECWNNMFGKRPF